MIVKKLLYYLAEDGRIIPKYFEFGEIIPFPLKKLRIDINVGDVFYQDWHSIYWVELETRKNLQKFKHALCE